MPSFDQFDSQEALIEAWEADTDCWVFSPEEKRVLAWANAGAAFQNVTIEMQKVIDDMIARRLVKTKDTGTHTVFIETSAGAIAAHRAFMDPSQIANEHMRTSRYEEEAVF